MNYTNEDIDPDEIDLTNFRLKDDLNPKFWENNKLDPKIRKNLLKIADDFFTSLELGNIDIEDVTLTGSLANYNWSKFSDIDLHIVIDYDELDMDKDLGKDFLKAKTVMWGNDHDIKIYGYDVELYVQDNDEPHYSTGVYSVLKNEWITKPKKRKISINDKSVQDKASILINRIDDLYEKYESIENHEEVILSVNKIKDKIKKMRQAGLETGGEYSTENIVFKVLRRMGYLDKLSDIKNKVYDRSLTIENGDIIKEELLKEVKVKSDERIKLYEDDTYLVVVPLTHTASCKYGAYTKWCTATPSETYYWEKYSIGILIYYLNKKTGEKFAESINETKNSEFWDSNDKRHTSLPDEYDIIRKKIINKINSLVDGLDKKRSDLKKSGKIWFENLLNELKILKSKNYPYSVFLGKSKNDIFMEAEYNDQKMKNGDLWVSYSKIWDILMLKFGFNRQEIVNLIKDMVEKRFKLGVLTPEIGDMGFGLRWKRVSRLGGINTRT